MKRLVALVAAAFAAGGVFAETYTWADATKSGNWSDAAEFEVDLPAGHTAVYFIGAGRK